MYLQNDHVFQKAIVERLERLYYIDGRDKKDHPQHGIYTGLSAKYNGIGSSTDKA